MRRLARAVSSSRRCSRSSACSSSSCSRRPTSTAAWSSRSTTTSRAGWPTRCPAGVEWVARVVHLARRRASGRSSSRQRQSSCSGAPSRRSTRCSSAGGVVGITVLVAVLKNVYERARPDLGSRDRPAALVLVPERARGDRGRALRRARAAPRRAGAVAAPRASPGSSAPRSSRSRSARAACCSTSTSSATSSPASPSASPGSAAARSCASVRGAGVSDGLRRQPQLGSARGRPGEPTSRAAARGARSPARLGS